MSWSDASSHPSPAERRRRRSRVAATLLVALVAAGAPANAQRLIVLPAENLSGDPEAAGVVSALVESEVAARGWDFLAGERVERELAKSRIRRLDALPAEAREALLIGLSADAYLAITVFSFRTEQVPLAAVGVRLVGLEGEERFNQVIGLSTENTRNALDQQPRIEVEPLLARVIEQLFKRFPEPGKKPRQRKQVDSPARLHAPRTFPLGRPSRYAAAPARRRASLSQPHTLP